MSTEQEQPQGASADEATTEAAADQAAAAKAYAAAEAEGAAAAVAAESQDEVDPSVEEETAPDPLAGKTDEEIRGLAAQAGEYLNLAQRTRADFDNFRKRSQAQAAAAKVRGAGDLTRELLPAIDNVERALEHEGVAIADAGEAAGEHAKRVLQALENTHYELVAALGRGGIERFVPLGEPFDPTRHEAVARRPADEGEASGVCGPVFQPGYAAGDEIIRPARVVVTD